MTDITPHALAISYAPADLHPALTTLFAIDRRLADIVRTTREPLVGQMRLTWWHDALVRLDTAAAPAEPLLRAAQHDLLPHGIAGHDLAALTGGWDVLLDPLDRSVLAAHGDARGVRLFALAGRLLSGESDQLVSAGRGWALADLACHLTSDELAEMARGEAQASFDGGFAKSWPRALRPIGALALLARLSLNDTAPMTALLRLARFRTIGW